MSDIVERLRHQIFHGPTMEAVHTKTVEWQAAAEITRLRADLEKAKKALRPFAEHEKKYFYVPSDSDETWTTTKLGNIRRAASTLKEIEHK